MSRQSENGYTWDTEGVEDEDEICLEVDDYCNLFLTKQDLLNMLEALEPPIFNEEEL